MGELDGNRAAGLLWEVFGGDMTAAAATCAGCSVVAPLGESDLYMTGVGTVMSCRACGRVLAVITRIRGTSCVDTMGMSALDMSRGA